MDKETLHLRLKLSKNAHPELWEALSSIRHRERAERLRTLATMALGGGNGAPTPKAHKSPSDPDAGTERSQGASAPSTETMEFRARLRERFSVK